MKYVLKKELPFAVSGTELHTEETLKAGTKVYVLGETFSNQKEYILLGYLTTLLHFGWVEEVKPREFMLVLVNGKPYDYSRPPRISIDKTETIKVREVIE